MKAVTIATLLVLGLTTGTGSSSPAHARGVCPVAASRALDEAEKILAEDDTAKLGIAIDCIAQALAQTRAELAGLREGHVAFSGQVNAPKGFVMSKPSVQEVR